MDDPNAFYGTVVQASATMVGVIAGFLTAYGLWLRDRGERGQGVDLKTTSDITWTGTWVLLALTLGGIMLPLGLMADSRREAWVLGAFAVALTVALMLVIRVAHGLPVPRPWK